MEIAYPVAKLASPVAKADRMSHNFRHEAEEPETSPPTAVFRLKLTKGTNFNCRSQLFSPTW